MQKKSPSLFTSSLTLILSASMAFLGVSTLLVYAIGDPPDTPSGEQNGGIYAYYLRQMLGIVSPDTLSRFYGDNPGTNTVPVRNTSELGGRDPDTFQRKIVSVLCPDGQYLLSIREDGGLNCSSTTVNPTPDPLSAPTGLAGTPGNTSVFLTWVASTGAPTDYIIEYKASISSTWGVFNDGVSIGTSTTVTGLTNGTSYDFRVRATNASGESGWSGVISVTPVGGSSRWELVSCSCMPTSTVSAGNNMTGYEDYLSQSCATAGQNMLAGAQDYCGGTCRVRTRGIATLRCGG